MNKKKGSKTQTILISLLTFYTLGGNVLTPLWAHFTEHLGGDVRSAGIAVAIFFFSFGISTSIFSFMETKYHYYKLYISFSYFILILISIAYFIIDTVNELYFIQTAVGIACALQAPAFDTIFGNGLKKGEEAKGWGLYGAVECSGIGASAFFAAQLVHYHGYPAIFSFMVLMNTFAFIASLFLPKTLNPKRVPTNKN